MFSMADMDLMLLTAPSAAVLLDKLMELEGEVSLACSITHTASDAEPLRIYYSSYIFALLLEDQIYETHMLLRRLPETLVKVDPILQSVISLVRAVWNKNYDKIYSLLRQTPWPEPMNKSLVQQYHRYFHNKTFDEISFAFGSIRPSTAAHYLGLDSLGDDTMSDSPDGACPKLVDRLTGKGWEWNPESKLFIPKVITEIPKETISNDTMISRLSAQQRSHGD
ncbi:hypothetical protein PAAG_04720 [Paracoccidioides lutzii Pb01]|uniref:CSN8/PSMD8/EIF3K domain-containing protein n=1 Tax=Paracoccidioides lutzii (strain ATCC MYA-826 / Pb01) TaxID=502779 RepID=C1H291_PARBA|nr:hypothetical protein PAAG_04720 [Paracoccidioides lutzii Pb01]EEH33671.2 hypothetical protein PAAG_04720 [Paracoccidioides lutzii Pb01]